MHIVFVLCLLFVYSAAATGRHWRALSPISPQTLASHAKACEYTKAHRINDATLAFPLKKQVKNAQGLYESILWTEQIEASKTAVIIVDSWDHHWCTTYERASDPMYREAANPWLHKLRMAGSTILFAPADVYTHYKTWNQYKKIDQVRKTRAFGKHRLSYPKLPWQPGNGCPNTNDHYNNAWSRITNELAICPDDGIHVDPEKIYNWFLQKGIKHIFYIGEALNMCLLFRPFGVPTMCAAHTGFKCSIVRELTYAGLGHADLYKKHPIQQLEAQRLMYDYYEKNIVPSTFSEMFQIK